MDRPSPLDYRHICDFTYFWADNFPNKNTFPQHKIFSVSAFNAFGATPVLFVATGAMRTFIATELPQIRIKFVLVSGDSDGSNPGILSDVEVKAILLATTHWYGMNCDRILSRFTCLPLGIGQWNGLRELLQLAVEKGIGLTNGREASLNPTKTINVLAAFTRYKGHTQRNQLWVDACANYTCTDKTTGIAYYSMLSKTKWVLVPFGMGLDSYRLWETIWMDSYPIVESHPAMDTMYTDLPVLIVKKFRDLNTTFLESMYSRFRTRRDWKFEKTYIRYWNSRFRSR
jgi:hypothetical protein